MISSKIDVEENKLFTYGIDVLELLLKDKSTQRNIIWATNDYEMLGAEYNAKYPITIDLITGKHSGIIQPRILKTKYNQESRTKRKAEVFTPAWICNKQNNLTDDDWFGRSNVFNAAKDKTWIVNSQKISFLEKKGKRWQDYVDAKRLEITCGEAPYLTSRYDMASGRYIEVFDRIGLLDRKLRVVCENTNDITDWTKWAIRAIESIYGFEYQGDNLFIARENIIYSFIENMKYKFGTIPEPNVLKRVANIIAWNIWQMDGITCTVPYGSISEQYTQISMEKEKDKRKVYCKIHDWRSKETLLFKSLVEQESYYA